MGKLFYGDVSLGGSGIVPVDALPTANDENYDKHELYLNSEDLYYIKEKSIFVQSNANETIYDDVFSSDAKISGSGVAYCNGYFYFFGGGNGSAYGMTQTIAKIDEATRTYTKISDGMPNYICNSPCITIGNYIYILGGVRNGGSAVTSIYKYDTTTNTLTTLQSTMPASFQDYSTNQNLAGPYTYFYNDKYYLFYPTNSYTSEALRTIYYFDNTTESLVSTEIVFTGFSGSYLSATCYNGKLLYDTAYNTKELIDLESKTKTQCSSNFGMSSGLLGINSNNGYCRDTSGNLKKINISDTNATTLSSTIITTQLSYTRIYQNYCKKGNKFYNFYSTKMYVLSFEGTEYSYNKITTTDVT